VCGEAYVLPFLSSEVGSSALSSAASAILTSSQPTSQQSASPAGDTTGYWYGTDGTGPTVSSGAPYREPVTNAGYYGWYVGEVGSWAQWQGCTGQSNYYLNQNSADYQDVLTNYNSYSIGVGFSAYWMMAGPGRDPNYNGTTSVAGTWGQDQAVQVYTNDLSSWNVTWPVILMDIEAANNNGWNAAWASPCSTTETANSIADSVDIATFNGFWNYIENDTPYSPAVYCAPVGSSSWTSIFGTTKNLSHTAEWTYEEETTSLTYSPSAWSIPQDGISAQFFAGQSTASTYAMAWQWSGGDGYLNGYGDFDQLDSKATYVP